jgi:hypothetical protein
LTTLQLLHLDRAQLNMRHALAHGSAPCGLGLCDRSRKQENAKARAGLIRALHVALYLVVFGTVVKNCFRDIHEGVNLTFEGIDLAIRHDSAFSDEVWASRKAKKSDGRVVPSSRS